MSCLPISHSIYHTFRFSKALPYFVLFPVYGYVSIGFAKHCRVPEGHHGGEDGTDRNTKHFNLSFNFWEGLLAT